MALIVTLLLATMFAALASALTIATATEVMIAAAYRDGVVLLYAADAGAEFAAAELVRADWHEPLDSATPILESDVAAMTGQPVPGSARVQVWVRDITGEVAPADSSRIVAITSVARGLGRAERTVLLIIRLRPDGENVRIDRLSWTSGAA